MLASGDLRSSRIWEQPSVTLRSTAPSLHLCFLVRNARGIAKVDLKEVFWPESSHFVQAQVSLKS